MRRVLQAAGAVLIVVASGCSSARVHPAVPTASTLPAPNPDVIPPVITAAYVNAVFTVLNHINGNATRSLFRSNSVTPTVSIQLRAIFNSPLFGQEMRNASASLSLPRSNLRQPLGDIVTTVVRLISATPKCIFVETTSSFTAVLVKPSGPASSEYWALQPKQPGIDPGRTNPTPWALSFNADYLTPTPIPDQCGVL
jgi:hypothetical protein